MLPLYYSCSINKYKGNEMKTTISFNTMFTALNIGDKFYIAGEECVKTSPTSYNPQRCPRTQDIEIVPEALKMMLAELHHDLDCM